MEIFGGATIFNQRMRYIKKDVEAKRFPHLLYI